MKPSSFGKLCIWSVKSYRNVTVAIQVQNTKTSYTVYITSNKHVDMEG